MAFPKAVNLTKKLRFKKWYEGLALAGRDQSNWVFMNYGYAPVGEEELAPELSDTDEWNRYPIQLYHHVYSKRSVEGKDVLEVGSGRGGGASYAARTFAPKSLTGLDFSANAVALCNEIHDHDNLSFKRGDAEALPFDDESFDVVVTVEVTHCFAHFHRFVNNAARVLRPGGVLLLADFRGVYELEEFNQAFSQAPLQVVERADITANVLASLDLEEERKRAFFEQTFPAELREWLKTFGALRGSDMYEAFTERTSVYFTLVAEKPT